MYSTLYNKYCWNLRIPAYPGISYWSNIQSQNASWETSTDSDSTRTPKHPSTSLHQPPSHQPHEQACLWHGFLDYWGAHDEAHRYLTGPCFWDPPPPPLSHWLFHQNIFAGMTISWPWHFFLHRDPKILVLKVWCFQSECIICII